MSISDSNKTAPNYLEDEHLSIGTKEYLKVLNAGDTPVESLPPTEGVKCSKGPNLP